MMTAIAALPMYDFVELQELHDALWNAIAARLDVRGVRPPKRLSRERGHFAIWKDPHLLLGQGCEFPLAKSFSQWVRPIATPCYSAPGCGDGSYRSAIVVRAADPAQTLLQLRGRRCVINEIDSNSGMNLLRAAIAPLADRMPFFDSVQHSGSHRRSAAMVASGLADVAALDCVSYAHFQRWDPPLAGLRVLAWSEPSPSLPYITARATDAPTLAALRSSLTDVMADPALAPVREGLLLAGVKLLPDDYAYTEVLGLEQRAAEHGYPTLL